MNSPAVFRALAAVRAQRLFCCAPLLLALLCPAPARALTPEEERASFHLADPNLQIELVAAEPDIISPVAIAWDAAGRLFVAEMRDYPNASEGGRIKLLVDRDHDGHYETVSIFADGLPFPNGVLPWNGGVLVTAAPDLWFLKDTNGDGRADERRVLFTGFGAGNQQLRANGLLWGLDGWVYGANGRSDGELRSATAPQASKAVSLRNHDFRFRPGTGEIEAVAGRSQFGLARDDWGNRFLSWNTIPIRHDVLPERYLSRNPNLASTESLQDLLEPGDTGRVFPLTPAPLTFNDESTTHFNALAGLSLYRGDALGPAYAGNAFVGESLRNLVHRRVLEPSGPTFIARREEQNREFLASEDPWFHPVNFATGPDGALYVVDFYRRFVEHPDFVRGRARDEMPWRTGFEHGRLWRIRRQGRPLPPAHVQLEGAAPAELVAQLARTNAWWRDTAQRLLLERGDVSAVPALERLARHGLHPAARVQALHTLAGLARLSPPLLQAGLRDPHPRVREIALHLGETHSDGWRKELPRLQSDPDSRVRLALTLALGDSDLAAKVLLPALVTAADRDATNRWHALALLSSVGSNATPLLEQLLTLHSTWRSANTPGQAEFLERLATLAGGSDANQEWARLLPRLPTGNAPSHLGELALGAGLAEGLARTRHPWKYWLTQAPDTLAGQQPRLVAFSQFAANIATNSHEPASHRLLALRTVRRAPGVSDVTLPRLLEPSEPPEVQKAAARALFEVAEPATFRGVFASWPKFLRGTRREIALAAARTPIGLPELLEHLERGAIQLNELDAPIRQAMRQHAEPALRRRAEQLLQATLVGDRAEVVQRFQPALALQGDRGRGAVWFEKACLQCHALQGRGQVVGPDLAGIGSRPKEAILIDILEPNRVVAPDYVSYTVVTHAGDSLAGLLAAETATSITLRRAGQPDESILRSQITETRAEARSLMPDGLEQGMSTQDMADLLEFLIKPGGN
jgi:putative membrane-bound dehydrogenase-like protein